MRSRHFILTSLLSCSILTQSVLASNNWSMDITVPEPSNEKIEKEVPSETLPQIDVKEEVTQPITRVTGEYNNIDISSPQGKELYKYLTNQITTVDASVNWDLNINQLVDTSHLYSSNSFNNEEFNSVLLAYLNTETNPNLNLYITNLRLDSRANTDLYDRLFKGSYTSNYGKLYIGNLSIRPDLVTDRLTIMLPEGNVNTISFYGDISEFDVSIIGPSEEYNLNVLDFTKMESDRIFLRDLPSDRVNEIKLNNSELNVISSNKLITINKLTGKGALNIAHDRSETYKDVCNLTIDYLNTEIIKIHDFGEGSNEQTLSIKNLVTTPMEFRLYKYILVENIFIKYTAGSSATLRNMLLDLVTTNVKNVNIDLGGETLDSSLYDILNSYLDVFDGHKNIYSDHVPIASVNLTLQNGKLDDDLEFEHDFREVGPPFLNSLTLRNIEIIENNLEWMAPFGLVLDNVYTSNSSPVYIRVFKCSKLELYNMNASKKIKLQLTPKEEFNGTIICDNSSLDYMDSLSLNKGNYQEFELPNGNKILYIHSGYSPEYSNIYKQKDFVLDMENIVEEINLNDYLPNSANTKEYSSYISTPEMYFSNLKVTNDFDTTERLKTDVVLTRDGSIVLKPKVDLKGVANSTMTNLMLHIPSKKLLYTDGNNKKYISFKGYFELVDNTVVYNTYGLLPPLELPFTSDSHEFKPQSPKYLDSDTLIVSKIDLENGNTLLGNFTIKNGTIDYYRASFIWTDNDNMWSPIIETNLQASGNTRFNLDIEEDLFRMSLNSYNFIILLTLSQNLRRGKNP